MLELGCGAGVPTTQRLAERFAVTGVDISARQIALARRNVPGATFMHADMTALAFAAETFDAVCAFYAFSHVPREEHAALLRQIAAGCTPSGLLRRLVQQRRRGGRDRGRLARRADVLQRL